MTDIHITTKYVDVKPQGFYVYLHRRATNNEIFYVGKGSGNRAWYLKDRNPHWRNVAAKNGVIVDVLQENMSEACAFTLEKITIRRFEGCGLTNVCSGGQGPSGRKPWNAKQVYCSNGIRFDSCHDAAMWAGADTGGCKISSCANGVTGSAYGYNWSYEDVPKSPVGRYERTSDANATPVVNDLGFVFSSARRAALWVSSFCGLDARHSHISRAARKQSTAYGFTWSRDLSKAPRKKNPNRENVRGSMRGVSTSCGAMFDSIADATNWLRVNGHPKARSSGVHAALNGKAKTAYGYFWEYTC